MTRHADPETVLRLACERILLATSGPQRVGLPGDSIGDLASAFVVLAGLPASAAQQVVDDYTAALSLRGEGLPFRHLRGRGHAASPPRTLPAVAQVGRTMRLAGLDVHVESVVMRAGRTDVHISLDPLPKGTHGPPVVVLRDDTGTTSQAHFNGGGDDGWEGSWSSEHALSPATAWIEVDGTRIQLAMSELRHDAVVEARTDGPLSHRYLWQRLVTTDHGMLHNDPLVEALFDAGVLSEADAEVLAAYAIAVEAMSQWGQPVGALHPVVPARVSSYLRRRGSTSRREVFAPLATVTTVDSFEVALFSLRAVPEGFRVQCVLRGPGNGWQHRFGFEPEVRTESLAWWAEDDRGNSYLGSWGQCSADGDETEGTLVFGPGLDPKATVLRLEPTTLHTRAVIEVALP